MARHIYTYDYIEAPFDAVAQLLAQDAPRALQDATEAAAAHADEVTGRLHIEIGDFEIGREIAIEVGDFEPKGIRTVSVPISWRAAERSALFPSLEATLEVSALALHPPLTQVSLIATYVPPLGPLGAAGDALLGHRVAEAALHRFLRDVVARIQIALEERVVAVPVPMD
jgi:hypothetical protein